MSYRYVQVGSGAAVHLVRDGEQATACGRGGTLTRSMQHVATCKSCLKIEGEQGRIPAVDVVTETMEDRIAAAMEKKRQKRAAEDAAELAQPPVSEAQQDAPVVTLDRSRPLRRHKASTTCRQRQRRASRR